MNSAYMHASELLQSRLTLCNAMDYSPPGSSVHGILQARILEWVSMSSSRGSSWPRDQRDQTASLTSTALAGGFFTTSVSPGKPPMDGMFFTSWATREALDGYSVLLKDVDCGVGLLGFQLACCCFIVTTLCPTLCDPMHCSTPDSFVLHHLPEFVQIHVHWFDDAI